MPEWISAKEAAEYTGYHIRYLTPVLHLAPRDEHVGLVAGAVIVHRRAGRTAVAEENLAIAPGLILVGDDVILQVAHLLPFLEGSPLSSPIL